MERRNILIEDTDGTDVSFMGYTVSKLGPETVALMAKPEPQQEPIQPQPQPVQLSPPESWWQWAWRILNTDIFELWRTYGPKGPRRD